MATNKGVTFVVLHLWLVGCSGDGQQTNQDGSVASRDGTIDQVDRGLSQSNNELPPFPHGECKTEGAISKLIGQGCAAGSNKSLCVMSGSASCASGVCIWDTADPTGQKAYCTIECKPEDDQSCPDSFSCKPDECDDLNVCVRTSVPKPPTLPYTITKNVVSSMQGLAGVAALPDGTSYWYTQSQNQAAVVFERDPQGKWSKLGTFGSQKLRVNGVASAGNVAYAFGGESYGRGWLVKLVGGTPQQEDLDNNVVGAFSKPNGNLVVLLQGWDNAGLHSVGQDLNLTPIESAIESTLEATINKLTPLQAHGFIAECEMKDKTRKLCVGTDGTDTKAIETPAELLKGSGSYAGEVSFSGLTTDDIWALSDKVNALMHYNGTKWDKETVPPLEYGTIHHVSKQVAIAYDRDRILQFNGRCWKSLIPEGADPDGEYEGRYPFTLAEDRVGWLKYLDFVELQLDVN